MEVAWTFRGTSSPTTLLQHPLRGGSQFSESIFWVEEVNLGVDMFEAFFSLSEVNIWNLSSNFRLAAFCQHFSC